MAKTHRVVRWHTADIAEAVEAGFVKRMAEDDAAHEVYGIDALDELGLHPIITQALTDAGYGAWREQRYPGHWHKTKKSHGLRCDLVLTPDGLPLRDPQIRDTLFDATPAVDPEAAYWLEIKTVAQFETGGPFKRYSAELLQPVANDVKKIWSDGVIRHGGLLIVLFTASQETAEHDLAVWHERCLKKGFPVGPPTVRGLPVNDRIGNAWCTIAVFGVRGV
ncbi:MAG: hypothetical protein GVY24_03925 [Planctomycetes bacterium]|nr:hypothetical protein [Planctomycetota bacterium]